MLFSQKQSNLELREGISMKLLKVKTRWKYKTLILPKAMLTTKDHKEAVYICELSEKEYNIIKKERK